MMEVTPLDNMLVTLLMQWNGIGMHSLISSKITASSTSLSNLMVYAQIKSMFKIFSLLHNKACILLASWHKSSTILLLQIASFLYV